MTKYNYIISLFLVICLIPLSPLSADKHGKDVGLSGEIELESYEKAEDPYDVNQDGAIEYFKALHTQMNSLAMGNITPAPKIDEGVLIHLTGVYLYRSIVEGTYRPMLDAVLEVDIINSRITKKPNCTNMLHFWKAWKDGDMQKKHGYAVKTGFIRKTQEFKKKVLPRYYRCKATVTAEIALDVEDSDSKYFSLRYGSDSIQKDTVLQIIEALEKTKKEIPDIFKASEIRARM